mmetsp:Transcript_49518/g.102133  ORF Transcript_49518/g.102133 Transcript_49518/m.102133 type:complete len:358 (+) Transcript_49518:313-1386(+)
MSRLSVSSPGVSGDATPFVDELLELVEKKGTDQSPDENAIRGLMEDLSSNAESYVLNETSPSALFEPLVGYYNVSYTLTSRPNDNPVGGKWTRGLWTVKRTMQHVLPPLPVPEPASDASAAYETSSSAVSSKVVAQVVNAIRLELLWGFVSIWVLLRGDAVPLKLDPVSKETSDEIESDDLRRKKKKSPPKLLPNLSDRTVKAYFDRPLIGFTLRNRKASKTFLKRVLTLGPTSAVILDTPYNDKRIRLGKGGTSGSQFVFSRLSGSDAEGREGWKWVIEENAKNAGRSLTKTKLMLRIGIVGIALGILSRFLQQRWMKVLAGVYALASGVSMLGLVMSTGGIETGEDTYMKGKEKE